MDNSIEEKKEEQEIVEKYLIFYKDELIAEVKDFGKGFIDAIEGMNAEIDVINANRKLEGN